MKPVQVNQYKDYPREEESVCLQNSHLQYEKRLKEVQQKENP